MGMGMTVRFTDRESLVGIPLMAMQLIYWASTMNLK